jgi:hypothetical protein
MSQNAQSGTQWGVIPYPLSHMGGGWGITPPHRIWDACCFCTGNAGLFAWSCRRRGFACGHFWCVVVGRTGPEGGRGYPPPARTHGWGVIPP